MHARLGAVLVPGDGAPVAGEHGDRDAEALRERRPDDDTLRAELSQRAAAAGPEDSERLRVLDDEDPVERARAIAAYFTDGRRAAAGAVAVREHERPSPRRTHAPLERGRVVSAERVDRNAVRRRALGAPARDRVRVRVDVDCGARSCKRREEIPEEMERRRCDDCAFRADEPREPGRDLRRQPGLAQCRRHPARQSPPGRERRAGVVEAQVERRGEVEHRSVSPLVLRLGFVLRLVPDPAWQPRSVVSGTERTCPAGSRRRCSILR